MRQRGSTALIVVIIFLLLGAIGLLVYQNLQLGKIISNSPPPQTISQTPTPSPVNTPQTTPLSLQETQGPSITEGWLTYKNEQYCFQISYPANYQALSDSNNLYGWPNAVVLIYGGGQSYDLPIEVWDSQSEYQAKYPNQANLTVKQVGTKYITLLNTNSLPEVDEIITTFQNL
jgi:hypothetical protein